VSGGDLDHTLIHHGCGEQAKFDAPVTVHTGVRRLAGTIAINEITDNLIGKLVAQIDTSEGNRQRIGNFLHPLQLQVEAGKRQHHEKTVHLIALLLQQGSGYRGVHPAAHGYTDFYQGHGQLSLNRLQLYKGEASCVNRSISREEATRPQLEQGGQNRTVPTDRHFFLPVLIRRTFAAGAAKKPAQVSRLKLPGWTFFFMRTFFDGPAIFAVCPAIKPLVDDQKIELPFDMNRN